MGKKIIGNLEPCEKLLEKLKNKFKGIEFFEK